MFISSSADRQLGCFSFFAIMNSATINIYAPVSSSLGYLPRSRVAGLDDSSMSNLLRNHKNIFYSFYTILHFSPALYKGSNSPHHQQLIFSFFITIAIPVDEKWYLIVGSLIINDAENLFMCLLAM